MLRPVDLLAANGILEVAGEHRVRGAVERSYRLSQERAAVSPEAFGSLTLDEHRDELVALIGELSAAITPRLANQATPDRARYLISPILFPVEKPSPEGADA